MNLTQISAAAVFYGSVVVLGVFALPSFIGAIKQSGIVRGIIAFVVLAGIIVGFETLAVKTGLPYGKFAYGTVMGRPLFGTTPWIVILCYPPIVIGCFWLARKISEGALSVLFTTIFTLATYLVIAPVFIKLHFWNWEVTGQVFNIPARAFAGWFICALLSSIALSFIWGSAEIKRLSAYSLFAFLLFWSGAGLGVGMKIPAAIGIAVCALFITLFILERHRDSDKAA